MRRRELLAGILSGAALAPLAGLATGARAQVRAGGEAINVVERFGFVPDGRTDNYEAFHRLADHATQNGGGHYIFPRGVYFVERFRTTPHGTTDRRHVVNAEYLDCDGLTLIGHGATIRLNGRFHRPATRGADGLTVGVHMATFMPFEIRRCRNVTIAGFEIDGGNSDMTRDPGVNEGYAHLIALNACSEVLLEDLHLHHGQVDGILLSDEGMMTNARPTRACRNVHLRRVRCLNNARGGLAPLQVFGLLAEDCEFSGNGFPGGRYDYHMPGFGVDIEPDRGNEGVDVDTKTGNLEFRRCNMFDNRSAVLAAYVHNFKGYCRFIDCNTRNREDANHIIATWPGEGILFEGGEHDCGPGCFWLSWQSQTGGTTILRNLTIRSSHHFGMLHAFAGNLARVENCSLIGTHTDASSGHFPFFAADPGGGRRNVFANNRIFIPAAHKDHSGPFDVEPNFHHTDLTGNEYRTDLAIPGEYFVLAFSVETCRVRNERFRGSFPGFRDTFRPVASEVHDTRLPYSYP